MPLSNELKHLIAVAAPLFAGEAEVVRVYWDSPVRTTETDLRWLELQCFKEFKGSGVGDLNNMGVIEGPLTEVRDLLPRMDIEPGVDRHRILDLLEGLYEEFAHLVAFADAYDAIRPSDAPPLDPHRSAGWEEDNDLTRLRYRIIEEHGEIGLRASKFTEGGYCGLFREGMAIKGRGPAEDAIAAACSRVYDDEFEHMLSGIAGLDRQGLGASDWALIERLVTDLLRLRIRMRNGQFSYPLDDARVQAIYAGDIDPIRFDFERAEALLA